jgi:hypothetical protein
MYHSFRYGRASIFTSRVKSTTNRIMTRHPTIPKTNLNGTKDHSQDSHYVNVCSLVMLIHAAVQLTVLVDVPAAAGGRQG